MTTATLILATYLAAGLLTAARYHRRHGLTLAGQWALLIGAWPLVLLVIYAANREGTGHE